MISPNPEGVFLIQIKVDSGEFLSRCDRLRRADYGLEVGRPFEPRQLVRAKFHREVPPGGGVLLAFVARIPIRADLTQARLAIEAKKFKIKRRMVASEGEKFLEKQPEFERKRGPLLPPASAAINSHLASG